MPTNKIRFTFNLNEEVLRKIKYLADADNRSISNMLEHLCKERIQNYERKNGPIPLNKHDS